MNKEFKKKWLTALRGGEYKQSTSGLSNSKGFCCLGVLCDITKEETGGEWDEMGVFFKTNEPENDGSDWLPPFVSVCLNIDMYGTLKKEVETINCMATDLGALNDGGATFLEIADVIEKQF